jgi:hypothetical protein
VTDLQGADAQGFLSKLTH